MATLSAEDALARFNDIEQHYNALLQRVGALEEEHRRTHAELHQARAQLAAGVAGGGKSEFRLIDPKSMVPDKLANRSQWRAWSEASRAYIENLDVQLAEHLKRVEGIEEALKDTDIRAAQINEQHAAQLKRYLKIRTEGGSHANAIIKAAQDKKLHPLEQWRLLSKEYDPKGLGSEFAEMQELMAPEKLRAKTVAGISAAIEAWEEMERRHKERNGIDLPAKLRTTVLFKLAPADLSAEILRTTTKWSSYEELKDHLHSLQFLRTSGPAPMLQNVEVGPAVSPVFPATSSNEDEMITTEDGELMRLEKRDGKRVAIRAGQPANRRGGARGQGRANGECFRCGRQGHRRADCSWSTHIDGGQPRPPLKPRVAGNIEVTSESPFVPVSPDVASPEKPLGTIDINALDDEEEWHDDVDDWADPWEHGADPWAQWPPQADQEMQCLPCAPQIPTLQDLYKARDVCRICKDAGVYERMMKTQRVDQYFTSKPMSTPATPPSPQVPHWAPDLDLSKIWLSSCVPEPPEPEVIEWDAQDKDLVVDTFHDCVDESPCHPCPAPAGLIVPASIDINAFDVEATHEAIDVTVDSGAGAPVCSPKHFPESKVVDSPGSLAGQVFSGAGGEKIPNQGQLRAATILENGSEGHFTFQAADVRKPLLAVSSVNDKGNLVLFDPEGSFILPAHNKALIAKLRQLVRQMTGKVDLHRKNGVYNMKAWRRKPGFSRQGA